MAHAQWTLGTDRVPNVDMLEYGDIEGPVRKFESHHVKIGGKRMKNSRRWMKILRPGSGGSNRWCATLFHINQPRDLLDKHLVLAILRPLLSSLMLDIHLFEYAWRCLIVWWRRPVFY